MDDLHPAPGTPAPKTEPTKRVVQIGDYLGSFAGYATHLRRKRMLRYKATRGGADVVPFIARVTEPADPVAHYFDTYKGMTETPGLPVPVPAAPLLPDRKAQAVRWLLARLGETSTYRGLFVLLGVAGWALTGEQSQALMALGMALSGAVAVFFPDKPGAE